MTPRLVFDLQATQSAEHGDRGIARYVKEHARALVARDAVELLTINPNLPFPRRLDQDLLASARLTWNTRTAVRRAADRGPLAWYVGSPFEVSAFAEGDAPPHLVRSSMPVVATLYDLIPLVHPERYLADPTFEQRYRARLQLVCEADLLLTISERTRADALRLLGLDPAKVVTIGSGVAPFFAPPGPGDDPAGLLARRLPQIRTPYVLTVAGGDPRKNTERLLRAWAQVPADVRADRQLVVACSVIPPIRRAWLDEAEAAGLGPDEVVITGWVDDEALRALYQRAELFAFPSLYEGFGLPVAEAVACGCPAVTSSTSSLPEVLDLPAATFDPTDVDAMAATITRGVVDDGFRALLRARGRERADGLSWGAVADRTLAALDRLEERPAGPMPVRIALVGPAPPTASGIADYNAALLPALAERAEVDVFSTSARPAALATTPVRWFPPKALGRTLSPWSYDAVVYTVGNSDDHHDTYELAEEFPGVLWLHDARLAGLYITYARERVPAGDERGVEFLRSRLHRQYRRRLGGDVDLSPAAAPPAYGGAGLGMTEELASRARAVVVSSPLGARLLRLDLGPDARVPPVAVLPIAAPPVVAASSPRAGAGAPVLASLGIVGPAKAPEVLIGALARLRRARPGATLVFAGFVPADYRAEIERLVDVAGVADAVTITGHLPRTEYERHLATATCAVQLRRWTNGESSAALTDCLAWGLPVVTNVASAAELPAGVVSLVPPSAGPAELAAHLEALLDRPERLGELTAAGQGYAASWGYPEVTAELVRLIETLPT